MDHSVAGEPFMTYCTHCGKSLDGANDLCPPCGANARAVAAPPPVYPYPQRNGKSDLTIVAIILAILVLLPTLMALLMYLMVMGFP